MTYTPKTSYNPDFYESLIAVESQHFWFKARNRVISTLVRRATEDLEPGYRVLEIGCGTGNVLRVLESDCEHGLVVGVDYYMEGLRYAQQRTSASLLQADVHNLPIRQEVDVIGLFDVLEHMPDDGEVLKNLYSKLRPGGVLLVTAPAHRNLWSYFDEASHHYRRYDYNELKLCLEQSGFRVDYLTEYMFFLSIPLFWRAVRL